MSPSLRPAALAGAVAALLACQGGSFPPPPDTTLDACRLAEPGECSGYTGSAAFVEASRVACVAAGGAWILACPPANRWGTCAVPAAGGARVDTSFYPGLFLDAPGAAAGCAARGGAWTAGPGGVVVGTPASADFACDATFTGLARCVLVTGAMPPEHRAALGWACERDGGTEEPTGTCENTQLGTCTRVRYGVTFASRHYDPTTVELEGVDCVSEGGSWTTP